MAEEDPRIWNPSTLIVSIILNSSTGDPAWGHRPSGLEASLTAILATILLSHGIKLCQIHPQALNFVRHICQHPPNRDRRILQPREAGLRRERISSLIPQAFPAQPEI